MVPLDEIEHNGFNLNLPRYIDASESEDLQDIDAHLRGGIPERDVDALHRYWDVCPTLRDTLFTPNRPGYVDLAVDTAEIKATIHRHAEFEAFIARMAEHFNTWQVAVTPELKALTAGHDPKMLIHKLSEGLLNHYWDPPLVDAYAVYQLLMDYWAETMQDDCYTITADGWVAQPERIIVKDKKGKEKDKGWTCDLVPKPLVVARYFADEQAAIDRLNGELEAITSELSELEEEHSGEDGAFSELDKINKGAVNARLKEIKADADADAADEAAVLKRWVKLSDKQTKLKKQIKEAEAKLDAAAYAKYAELTEDEVKALVVDDKWVAAMETAINGEVERMTQALVARVAELGERYASALPELGEAVDRFEGCVNEHLEMMGFTWE